MQEEKVIKITKLNDFVHLNLLCRWVVVAASFLVNLIADGVTFSFGVFFTEFTIYFKESESTTAWIGSLLAAMPLLSGPIASWLTDRYGCKNVTIVGGLLAAFGFVLSSYTSKFQTFSAFSAEQKSLIIYTKFETKV